MDRCRHDLSTNGAKTSSNGTVIEVNGHDSDAKNHNGFHEVSDAADLEGANITIITDRQRSDPLVNALAGLVCLHSGHEAVISSLSSIVPSHTIRSICLAEVDTPLLMNMNAETFENIQHLLLTCSSMLWVGTGAYHFAEHPANNIAQGLLRAIHSETGKPMSTLGRFIQIGKKDILSNTRLEMAKFEQNCTFSSVDLTLVANERPKLMGKIFKAVMDSLGQRLVQTIGPISTVTISEVESALRKLQSGKTTVKVVVSHMDSGQTVSAYTG